MYLEFFSEVVGKTYFFETREALLAWVEIEVRFYDDIKPHVRSGPVNRDHLLITQVAQTVRQNSSMEAYLHQLPQYSPYQGYFDQVIGLADLAPFRANVVAYMSNAFDQNLANQQQSIAPQLALLLARVLIRYGNPTQLLGSLHEAIDLQRTRLAEAAEFKDKLTHEWAEQKIQIDAMAANARLKAPKHYWEEKGKTAEQQLEGLKKTWVHSIGFILVIIGAFFDISLARPIYGNADLYELIERAVLFGSLLSIAVWWSRQR